MKIPYGVSDFERIRDNGFFYADKTSFLPALEDSYQYVVFLRPRRFGKSTLVSMLEHYYDLGRRERFDALFGGLWIHSHPTAEQGRYLVLTLDFSRVATDGGEDLLRSSFLDAVRGRVATFLLRYRDRIPVLADLYPHLDNFSNAEGLIGRLLDVVAATPYKIYLLIDEYDHFANRLLAAGEGTVYETIVKKTGFVRTFYATLKSGTQSGAVARMFVTGVSPLMLDDLSSGFNIATHASMDIGLNELAGFTRADTERAVDELLLDRPALSQILGRSVGTASSSGDPALEDRAALLTVLEQHYNGYRFSGKAAPRIFNSDMVLYFLSALDRSGEYPENMLDRNVRTEYGHLQRIGTLSGAAVEARLALLQRILSDGHIRTEIVDQFGVASVDDSQTHFLSLLYFLGMLTLGAEPRNPYGYDLEIPNRVIRELQWEHLALMLEEQAKVHIDVSQLREAIGAMAIRGEIEPFLTVFHTQVLQAFSNRDMRGLDEKTIKLLLMTYVSLGRAFYPLSEREFAQGYGDLFLAVSRSVAGASFSWLLEFKYLKAGAKPAQIEAAFAEAEAQVRQYSTDPALLPHLLGDKQLKAGMLVFVGAKKVLFRAWQRRDCVPQRLPQPEAKPAPAKPKKAPRRR